MGNECFGGIVGKYLSGITIEFYYYNYFCLNKIHFTQLEAEISASNFIGQV